MPQNGNISFPRKKILVFSDWYLPGFKAGGPIRSVSNMVNALEGEFDFWIFTRNSDFGEYKPYQGISFDVWQNSGKHRIFYASPSYTGVRGIRKLLCETKFDIYYFNSLFSVRFTLLPLLVLKYTGNAAKIILAPRGMLGSGALRIKKYKKRIFITLARLLGLYKNIIWQASSEHEEKEIRVTFGNICRIMVASNIPFAHTASFVPRTKKAGYVRLFFLSRILRNKNLTGALELLRKVSSGSIEYDIFGPVEDTNYWKECLHIIGQMPDNISVRYRGILSPDDITRTLSEYHFMFFPTWSENFGHSIAESLSAGCPVIISDQTPWKDLEQKAAGWRIALTDKKSFLATLRQTVEMDHEEYNRMSETAYKYAVEVTLRHTSIEQTRQLFLKVG